MPLVAIIAGLVMIDLAFRGTEHEFAAQAAQDFGTGSQFWAWFAAISLLGALGYVPQLRTLSNAAMALVIVVLTLRNGGIFAQLAAVIDNPPQAAPSVPLAGAAGGGGGGGGGLFGNLFGGGGGGPLALFSGNSGGGGTIQTAAEVANIAAAAG